MKEGVVREGLQGNMVNLLLSITILTALTAATATVVQKATVTREPRLFYISSSTTTSTLSTRWPHLPHHFEHPLNFTSTSTTTPSTVCFKSGTALATCAKKKRKRDIMEGAEEESRVRILPSTMEAEVESLEEVESSLEEGRDPKFLLYWATLTSTATSTSYTATQTIYSLECTPTGFGTSLCV